MNIKVPQIIDVLMKYGSFARPLVNWALSNDKISSAWKEYFKALTELNDLHNEKLPVLYMWVETRFGAALKTVKDFHWFPAAGGGPYLDDSHLWSIVR